MIDCDHVLHSKFSKVFGVPVSVPAFALYATMLSVLFFFRKSSPDTLLKFGWMVLTLGALSAAGAAVWFTGLQLAEWKFCPYCLGAHTCGLILATIVLTTNPLKRSSKAVFGSLAMTGVLALVAIQWQSEEAPTFVVETYDDVVTAESVSSDAKTEAEAFGAPMEFSAPEEFGAPMEFAPPVFDAPGIAETETGSSEDQTASLVPPPVDVTISDSESRIPESEAEFTETPNLLPLEAQQKEDSVEQKTNVASADSRNSVEYTPPMEVPVIISGDAADIQRVDFRTEQTEESQSEDRGVNSDEPAVAPSTSDSKSPKAPPVQTAVNKPTGLQVSIQKPRAAQFTSPKAMAYLFFSASGATNAAVSEALLLNATLNTDDEADAGKKKADAADKPKLVVVAGNRFSLNPKHWPLIGNPDADFIFVEMFDYTCPHCRVTNKAIEGAFKEYGDRLAVLTLPVPLERACNPTMNGAGKPGACEMAKLAIAVWRIDQPKFREYHHYMCDSQRTVSDARAKAIALVGKDKLDAELALPYAADYIKKHVELYKRVGSGSVPKLMFPRSTMTGEIRQASTLVSAIKRELDN